jgi:hypothetical protein
MAPRRVARVAVKTDEGISVHCMAGHGDWDTLCGIDANDPTIGHLGTVPVACNTKIDCVACRNIWVMARNYTPSDFK